MYQVGQDILGGQLVVASVDADNLILSVQFPSIADAGSPFTITYSAGVTEMFVANVLSGLPRP